MYGNTFTHILTILVKAEGFKASCLLTCDPLHLHAPGLDATFGQPLLGDDAADVVSEDEVGLQNGQWLGVGVGAGLMDDDVQCSAVVFNTRHLHVLLPEGGKKLEKREEESVTEFKQNGID